MNWNISKSSKNVYQLNLENVDSNSEHWVLLIADEHWDNPHCNRELLKKHHDQAVEREAAILKFGDTFCAMQGKYDRRSDKTDLRPEHITGQYLDRLVETAGEWFEPYCNNIALMGAGNHEVSISNRHETNLIERLIERLKVQGSLCEEAGYEGFIRITARDPAGTAIANSYDLYFVHGWGGGGPVTMGAIDFNRLSSDIVADLFVCGHIHQKMHIRKISTRLNAQTSLVKRDVHYIRCGPYKDDYSEGGTNWHIAQGRRARPLGGWWLRFTKGHTTHKTAERTRHRANILCEVMEAI